MVITFTLPDTLHVDFRMHPTRKKPKRFYLWIIRAKDKKRVMLRLMYSYWNQHLRQGVEIMK